MTASPPLPGCALRIGVTGTRDRTQVDHPRIKAQVTELLRQIALARGPEDSRPTLHLLSPLAEGSDRLVAECALAENYELVCPLPFPREIYENDFKLTAGSVDTFHALLARAGDNVLELDGARDDPANGIYAEARSYEAVGRLIVRNCDLLIGIWDGTPGKGRGGTADTIRYAASFGPPVIWIDTNEEPAEPRWIEKAQDLAHNAKPRPVGPALQLYLRRLLHDPEPHNHHSHHSLLHASCHYLREVISTAIRFMRRQKRLTPLQIFLHDRRHPVWGPWKLNDWFMRVMTWLPAKPPTPPTASEPPKSVEAKHWLALYDSPDNRASEYAARHRSGYVGAFLLAAIALTAAAAALAFADHPRVKITATATELIALLLIMGLVIADSLAGWQTRAIEYRLLGELCRKQQALAPLGGVVPRASAWATTEPAPHPERDKPFIEQVSWVSWLFSAWVRDANLPVGRMEAARVEAARTAAMHDLIDPQIVYHDKRAVRSHRAGKHLVRSGEVLFVGVLILVVIKLCYLLGGNAETMRDRLAWLGFFCAMLPAFSAALVGIRAYAELEMLAEQSVAMLAALKYAKAQIEELDPDAPLASQTLAIALAGVATLMLEDLEGWARLFRGKVLDA